MSHDCTVCETKVSACESNLFVLEREVESKEKQLKQAKDCFTTEPDPAKQLQCLQKILIPVNGKKT